MPAFCAVQNCGDKYGHADNISFHKFPFKRQELMQKWLDFSQRGPDWQPSKWSAICSRHFRDEDFNCSADRRILKKTAVPCVPVSKHLQGTENANIPTQHNEEISKESCLQQTKEKVPTACAKPSTETLEEGCEDFEEEDERRLRSAHLPNSPSAPKIKCRLCGSACLSVVSFSTNFEIYGMIQKCFPTLNIQKDDHLPKEMCRVCLKRLESFSRFVDKVLETQSELQRKYRTEKANNSARAVERQLKVKQEPVVRVKQEVAEGLESFLSDDLEMGVDEACDQEQETESNVEHKYDFCDFPMLNAQDIINNCDIMEIINLDDPFINIPDDDANTNCENGSHAQQDQDREHTKRRQQSDKRPLPSAHELLQTHLLSEEHNYAYTAEDLKEEWQLKNIYKTEKTEGGDYGESVEYMANVEPEDDEQAGYVGDDHQQGENDDTTDMYKENYPPTSRLETTNADTDKLSGTESTTSISPATETRSTRPIVTSVSELAEASVTLPNGAATDTVRNEKLVVTAVNDISAPTTDNAAASAVASISSSSSVANKTHAKPNIVVLNESIVKSSSVFQLHTCHCCHLKFFSVESLNQHYNVAHQSQTQVDQESQLHPEQQKLQGEHAQQQQQQMQQMHDPYNQQQQNMVTQNHYQQQQPEQLPMVSVPAEYLWKPYGAGNDVSSEALNYNCKLEKEFSLPTVQADRTQKAEDCLTYQQPNVFGQLLGFANPNPTKNTFITPNFAGKDASSIGAPNVVRILEMKRTFLRQHEPYNSIDNVSSDYGKIPTNSNDPTKSGNFSATNVHRTENQLKTPAPATPPPPQKRRKHSIKINSSVIARLSALERKVSAAAAPDSIVAEYRHLRRRYMMLQRKYKCLSVQVHGKHYRAATKANAASSPINSIVPTKKQTAKKVKFCFRCRICLAQFKSIYHLLRHRHARKHWPPKLAPKHFAATCCGCEKFFRHKIALHNHMRYICQALPLCWFKLQMRTFKCRCCRRSTFNHWRLYRRHEVRCKLARQRKKQAGPIHQSPANRKQRGRRARTLPPNISNTGRTSRTVPPPLPAKCKQQTSSPREYICPICAKVFASANSLNQHSITHTDQRRHQCRLCARAFKRRNGLTQHVRGFHLQLKPHTCTVCQRSYALKSDMLRCRHAAVKRANSGIAQKKNQSANSAKGRK
ncbi:uncharacterized protein LOC128863655 isoform X1 [Anastrepha ludens]|uniref:uncharacterized protein LOC128863655 isoform X1 n=1 Tax=Anastrepha ludens TaxID=28586 RepID=UPI0023B0BFED|nr:uncharacterized protein LOC128863655 isoform X1 [Anastrepha ludens]